LVLRQLGGKHGLDYPGSIPDVVLFYKFNFFKVEIVEIKKLLLNGISVIFISEKWMNLRDRFGESKIV